MKYKFFDEYVTKTTRKYILEIDDSCEVKMKDGVVYVDDIELYYILDEFERDEFNKEGPILVKINGVRILEKKEDENVNFVCENITKVKE